MGLLPLPGDAQRAARWFLEHQGALYDWQLVLGFVAWAIPSEGLALDMLGSGGRGGRLPGPRALRSVRPPGRGGAVRPRMGFVRTAPARNDPGL